MAGVASKFADYAVSVLEGTAHDCEDGSGQESHSQTPMTAQRPGRSALDVLRWNSGASAGPVRRPAKRQKTIDDSQLYLDFGQRNFYSTKCTVCDMYYCPGLASDEKLHEEFHKRVTHGIMYKGFKHQHTVRSFPDGSFIVCIRRHDPAPHKAKADEVRQMAERELGGYEGGQEDSSVTFLMISPERRAVGYLLAERIKRAYRIVSAQNCAGASPAAPTDFALATRSSAAGLPHDSSQDRSGADLRSRDGWSGCVQQTTECDFPPSDSALASEWLKQDAHADGQVANLTTAEDGSIGAPSASIELREEGCSRPDVRTPENASPAAYKSPRSVGLAAAGDSDDDLDDLEGLDLDALEAAAGASAGGAGAGWDNGGSVDGGAAAQSAAVLPVELNAEKTAAPDAGAPSTLLTVAPEGSEPASSGILAAGDVAEERRTALLRDEDEEPRSGSEAHTPSGTSNLNTVSDDGSLAERFQAEDKSKVAGAAGGSLPQQVPPIPGTESALEDGDDADLGVDESGYDESLLVSTEAEAAACGICQVWVHRRHRRKGVATRLLQAALECSGFLEGRWQVPSAQCAFSQVSEKRVGACVPASARWGRRWRRGWR
jgi:GNAT superfamily N-acetyltransferase